MKKYLLLVGLALVMVGSTGCIVIHTEKVEPRACPPPTPKDATIREIDAVGTLAFDHDRRDGYHRIAQRPGLHDGAQVYLVDVVFKRLAFEDAKLHVLLALVHNPDFSAAAHAALLDRLDQLAFEFNKRQILEALSAHESG